MRFPYASQHVPSLHLYNKSRCLSIHKATFINGNNVCVCAIVRNKQCNKCRRFVHRFSTKLYFNWAMFLTHIHKSRHRRRKPSCFSFFSAKKNRCSNANFCRVLMKLTFYFCFALLFIRVIFWSVDNYRRRGQAVIAMNRLSPSDTCTHPSVFFVVCNWNQMIFIKSPAKTSRLFYLTMTTWRLDDYFRSKFIAKEICMNYANETT